VAKIRGGGILKTLAWAFLFVVLALGVGIGLTRYADRIPWLEPITGQPTEDPDTVVQGIQSLNELATAEMTAQVGVTEQQEDAHFFFQRVPRFLMGEKILLIVRGTVKAGINLDELVHDQATFSGIDRCS
jgi:hypothetical protein